MATAEDYECFFKKPKVETVLFSTVMPAKEKTVNTYTLSARKISTVEFVEVEAESEDDAIYKVEYGDVNEDYEQFEEYTDIEVTDVTYGEVEYVADLTLTVHSRGVKEDDVRDMLWNLLMRVDGSTERDGEGEIEAIGFNIVNLFER